MTPRRAPDCAYCAKRPALPEMRPFCSKRCADLDLGQWLGGGYAIPGEPADQAETAVPGRTTDESG